MKYKELSANTVTFVSYKHRLAEVFADAARGGRRIGLG
jgi:hypothetical protein